MIKYEKHVLDNGLRVFLAPMHETQAMTLMYLYGVGSRYETAKENGLSHFVEHMFFKGTTKRPTTLDISQELDALGAAYNAMTGNESTRYFISAAGEHFPIAFDVLTDMLYDSKFEAEEINREKGVICEEIKMYHNDPMSYLDEVAHTLFFGDTPLGRDIAGTAETVKAFEREDFVRHREAYYGPANTILVIAGNPKGHDWLKFVKEHLSHLSGPQPKPHVPQVPQLGADKPVVAIGHRPIDQVHLNLMHYGVSHTDPRAEIITVMMNILGGTMSSRLFVEVREKRGLAYYAYGSDNNYNDIGTIECSAGVDPNKVEETVTTMLAEINRLKTESVTEVELKRAKENIKGRMSLRLEDSHSIARWLAFEELEFKRVKQPEEYLEMIEKVTASDIMEIAQELFTPDKRKLALVGPLDEAMQAKLSDIIKNS